MEIAVLGGGNGSTAAAVDLTAQGHNIRFWRRNASAQAELKARGNVITLKDFEGARPIRITMVTDDIGEAIRGAELIVCPTPATAQSDIAAAMAPHLADGQVVFLPPGSFGSWIMADIVRKAGNHADVSWAETGTLPYLTRLHGADT
ncbi:MAG TPA: glycerol-3-phosphate dehydrogenase, partial [Ruegeria sp.]|nr:glycerol-3-phosphate dehydrogenase [Ruegeria sp.]